MIDNEIIKLWEEVKRPGIDKFINWLKQSDFFIAPCSTKFHGSYKGGLAQHSLNVYNLLKEKVEKYNLHNIISKENIIVTGLGHDLCKVGVYSKDTRPATDKQLYKLKMVSGANFSEYENQSLSVSYCSSLIDWESNNRQGTKPEDDGYVFSENIPLGHGEKSIYILQKFIDLQECEAVAIRWHMAIFDFAVQVAEYPTGYSYRDAINRYSLVQMLILADYEASLFMEREWSQ